MSLSFDRMPFPLNVSTTSDRELRRQDGMSPGTVVAWVAFPIFVTHFDPDVIPDRSRVFKDLAEQI